MEKVENNAFVSVDYKGTLTNGEVFDSSEGRQPLEVQIGAGHVIKGFENALLGMAVNEKKTFSLEPEAAYGERDESYMHTFPRADIPPEMDPKVGETIGLHTPDGQQVPARITHSDDEKVIVDLNHPLAGETLTFEIEVKGVSKTPTQEPTSCGSGCDCSSGCC
ncbi:MAG: peptidylprolyl isomerase [Deltaproteobacteria bacterium]|nr:peptidylprolyl isomerase [Deltaproteobacteria bacterium]